MVATLQHVAAPADSELDESSVIRDNWKPLRYFNLYRATLSGLIITLAFFGIAPRYFGQIDSDLFWITALLYFCFSLACGIAIHLRWGSFRFQVVAQVLGDIVAITFIMFASGGVPSGFGMLLVVAIAGGSILTEGRIAILLAAMASLAVLTVQIYSWLYDPFPTTDYSQAGMLGVTFFATAYLAHVLAKKVRTSEALAERRGIDLANLAQLNEHIIQRMQSGILVLDSDERIRLMNGAARQLLGLSGIGAHEPLKSVAPELLSMELRWRREGGRSSQLFRPERGPGQVLASFSKLGKDGEHGALVYLEDASAMNQRAQQLKLASLGRLTASIAHEIRNPLGAISHAGQLLGESSELAKGERRLLSIIQENCYRMNAIVENVLQLSRRREASRESIRIGTWLRAFVQELVAQRGLEPGQVSVLTDVDHEVRFDPSQLHQVVWNLCENGLRHGGTPVHLELRAGLREEVGRPYLDVIDNGKGITEDTAQSLFEPFFTTEPTGTGLGLYIARELCEINQASLDFLDEHAPGCCFRIGFSNPMRRGVPVA